MQTDIILLPINIQFDSIKRLAKCQCQTQFIHYVTFQLHLKHADWNVPTIVFKNILTAPLFPVVCVFNEHSLSHVQLHYSVFHILKATLSTFIYTLMDGRHEELSLFFWYMKATFKETSVSGHCWYKHVRKGRLIDTPVSTTAYLVKL